MFNLFFGIFFVNLLCTFGIECRETASDFSSVEIINAETARKTRYEKRREDVDLVLVELSESVAQVIEDQWNDIGIDFNVSQAIFVGFTSQGTNWQTIFDSDGDEFVEELKRFLSQNFMNIEKFTEYLNIFHALGSIPAYRSSVLLVTKSKVSDTNIKDQLTARLVNSGVKLFVLWLGRPSVSEYGELLFLTQATGGRLLFLPQKAKKLQQVILNESNQSKIDLPIDNKTDWLNRLRFPDSPNPNPADIDSILLLRGSNDVFRFPVIVDVASGANLEIRPGTPTRIPFTIKNNLNSKMNVIFGAKYKNKPQFIQPDRAILQPLSTTTVTVHVSENANEPANTNSTLTFSTFLANQIVSRSAFISHVPLATYDKTQPKLYYKFGGDCTEYESQTTCENGFWGVEITAQDEESGILKITSEPAGLLFPPGFVAGTKLPVTAYYSASCCQSKVDIWVEDLHGNFIKKSLDVFNQSLLVGEIAAIVLGVLLLLFLIIAIIVAITMARRRNQRNLIIARPRADSR